jgi:hypothetical protein
VANVEQDGIPILHAPTAVLPFQSAAFVPVVAEEEFAAVAVVLHSPPDLCLLNSVLTV